MTEWAGAARGTRTPDPRITNAMLYQLSYCGMFAVDGCRTDTGGKVAVQVRMGRPGAADRDAAGGQSRAGSGGF